MLLGKNTVNHVCILQKRLRKAVFADPHSIAVRTSRGRDLFSRHYYRTLVVLYQMKPFFARVISPSYKLTEKV